MPDIVINKNRSFIIVWQDYKGIGRNIYMQMFNRNGIPIGVNQMVNDTIGTMDYCGSPKIKQDSSGNFVVAFDEYNSNYNFHSVKYQRYNKSGVKIGTNKEIGGSPNGFSLSSFDCDENGNLIFQINTNYAINVRIDKFDNLIGSYFYISNEYPQSNKNAEDVRLFNKKIINVWIDDRLTPQPQVYANVRSYINPDSTVGIINISKEIPGRISLFQNYPNPFNPVTKIKFDVYMDSRVRGNDRVVLKVYDMLGKEIETLVNEKLSAGTYEVTFNASQYPSGVYFYRLEANGNIFTRKMILLK
jgi:hypothetical protein